MFTSTQLLVFLGAAAVLLATCAYGRHRGSGTRLASTVLPGVFLLLAAFLSCNVFNMLTSGRVSVRRFSSPSTFNSDSLFFWFLVALQVGAVFLMIAVAIKSWVRRNEA